MDLAKDRTDQKMAKGKVELCPLCGSSSDRHRYFDRLEHDSIVEEYRLCTKCGLVFQATPMSSEELDAFYRSGYRQSVQGSEDPTEKDVRIQNARARHLVQFTEKELDTVVRCLDIGSSTGMLLKSLRSTFGCDLLGVEPGSSYREFSIRNGIKTVGSLSEIDPVLANRFNLVTMAHVLEHLSQPVDYLRGLRTNWLTQDGFLLVEVPNLYGHQSLEPAHLLAFSASTLRQTLRSAGFQTLKMKVHGRPRSRLIPLYLTVLARVNPSSEGGKIKKAGAVTLKRRVGMGWRRWVTRILPRWAWLPWPE